MSAADLSAAVLAGVDGLAGERGWDRVAAFTGSLPGTGGQA
jgi:hypothetical protein